LLPLPEHVVAWLADVWWVVGGNKTQAVPNENLGKRNFNKVFLFLNEGRGRRKKEVTTQIANMFTNCLIF